MTHLLKPGDVPDKVADGRSRHSLFVEAALFTLNVGDVEESAVRLRIG